MRPGWILLLLMSFSITVGCGPALSEEELGHVVYEVPMVPGAETPYPLPELKVPTSEAEVGESSDGHTH